MALDPVHYPIVKADILAKPDLNVHPNTPDGNFAIADLYNLHAVPDYWVFRTLLDKHDVYGQTALDVDGVTVTSWSWTLYTGLNPGEQGGWVEMWNETGIQDPSRANVRSAWADIFSGGQPAQVAQRAHLSAMARRRASRIEALLATGTGLIATPSTMTHEGRITFADIGNARNS